jgi:hypothetical protein
MTVKGVGKLGVGVRKMKVLTVKMETVTDWLVKVDRSWPSFNIKYMKLIIKYFFLAYVVYWGGGIVLY